MTYPNPKNIIHVTTSDITAGRTRHVTQEEIAAIQEVKGYKTGMVEITNGSTSKAITGLALSGTPSFINVTIVRPTSGSPLVFASVSMNTVTSDGFTAEFSSSIPSAGYYLSYILKV